jgi:basic membrane lipoprotein Med (substrate-binding protein (PBP1-ABC) superfamily)
MPGKWRITALTTTIVATLIVGLVVEMTGQTSPARARQYLAFKACLLTDSQGIAGKAAAPAWAGMQTASLSTRAKVQFLAVSGSDTAPNAMPYLASLVQLHCDLIIAAGATQTTAIAQSADRFPKTQFAVLGSDPHRPNVTAVNVPATDVPGAVAKLISGNVT